MKEWTCPKIELLPISHTQATCTVVGKVEGTLDSNDEINCAATS